MNAARGTNVAGKKESEIILSYNPTADYKNRPKCYNVCHHIKKKKTL